MSAEDKELDAALTIAKRAGLLIMALGIADSIHGLVNSPEGSANFRIGGVLVGLLMLFGGLRILAVVRWFALLAFAVLVAGLLASIAVVPFGLLLAQLRLYPASVAASVIPWAFSVAIALVAALRLSHPQLLAVRARAGRTVHSAGVPVALGMILAVGVGCIEYRVVNGEAAKKASRAVADKLGTGYQYFTNSLNKTIGSPTKFAATVQAWNEREVRTVPVQWQE